jgi:aldehyde:ferredoxin oxidoreductase
MQSRNQLAGQPGANGQPGNLPGYHGRYLHVDLNTGSGRWIKLESSVLRQFLGGSGLGTWLLLQHGAAAIDPLEPEAPLAFVFSPLVGSPLTTSAKFAVVARSPLTQRLNDSLASSGFALAGKRTGADAVLITGRAAEPSVLVIDDGQVRLEPAGPLWGTGCERAQRELRQRFGGDYQSAVIGPAGENQVRYATISHDGRHAGRGGHGAVLGAKQLKALVVRGTQRCGWADPEGLTRLAKQLSERSFGPATAKYRELGTATNLLTFNRLHALPTRNFQQGSFAGAERLSPEALSITRSKTRSSCAAGTIGCEHLYSLAARDGETSPRKVRLEYENLFALGPMCAVDDPDVVLEASRQCDELGLDTISAGGTIAFAMECVERGWLTGADWLRFGDGQALLRAIDAIGRRQGIGDALADGSRLLAQSLCPEALDLAPQVKGLELPGYEPRALQTMALGFAVSSRGADHNRSGAYEADFSTRVDRRDLQPAAALEAIASEDKAALMDSLILCKFLRGVFDDFYEESAEMLRLVTGWDVSSMELRETAARIVTARKRFNILAGWTPAEDMLPERFLQQALADDPQARLTRPQLLAAIEAYNLARGWTREGWLPAEA